MTPQEQQMIDGLISRIRNTSVQDKDTGAEEHIRQGLSGSADALYVLVQTVLVQQYGLEQAQSQINELKAQVQTLGEQAQSGSAQKSSSGSFLSHIFGGSKDAQQPLPASSGQYQPVNNPGYGSQGGYAPPPPPYPGAGYPAPGGGFGGGFMGGAGGGFLRGAMQTAAGVAAGQLMFQGMEDLFHGFGGGGGRGFSDAGSGGETVVNNYYDDDREGGSRDQGDRGGEDRGFYNPDDDASRNDPGSATQSASDFGSFSGDDLSNGGSDSADFDDSSSDPGGFDDSGSDDFSGDNS